MSSARYIVALLPSLLAAFATAWSFRGWLVDDAAISYAYARNLTAGMGLVAQLGATPVEGFSNPLWVALLSPIVNLPAVDAYAALKLVSWGSLGLLVFAAAVSVADRRVHAFYLGAFLLVLVLQPPVAIWSNAGLETPLFSAAIILLARSLCLAVENEERRQYHLVLAGIAAASCSLLRPEGTVFLLAAALVVALTGSGSIVGRVRHGLRFLLQSSTPFLAYLSFRLFYFHDLLPNTFYAKGGITPQRIGELAVLSPDAVRRVLSICEAIAGYWAATAAFVGFVAILLLAARKSVLSLHSRIHVSLMAVAVAVFSLLPGDWMGEWRYAVPAILLYWLSAAHICADLQGTRVQRADPKAAAAIVGAVLVMAGICWVPRIREFRDRPALPVKEVVARSDSFEESAKLLKIIDPSILTQDVGGFLLRDRLRVFDAGMLTDRRIAQDIGEWRKNAAYPTFYDYVFEDLKPTFISLVAFHAWRANLSADARLLRDYLPVRVAKDPWILRRFGLEIETGDYVRRSAVQSDDQIPAVRHLLLSAYAPLL